MFVEIIIPTYDRPAPLKSMLASLVAQTDEDWGAHVLIDNPEDSHVFKIVESFNDPRIRWTKLSERYNNWGHTPREIGKQSSTADYIIMSGDDNYYIPTMVKDLKLIALELGEPGMIYWDMVHSHQNYSYYVCVPAWCRIDMGAFATRRDLAQTIKLNTSYEADGEFVEEFKIKYPLEKIAKINKILFVHN